MIVSFFSLITIKQNSFFFRSPLLIVCVRKLKYFICFCQLICCLLFTFIPSFMISIYICERKRERVNPFVKKKKVSFLSQLRKSSVTLETKPRFSMD